VSQVHTRSLSKHERLVSRMAAKKQNPRVLNQASGDLYRSQELTVENITTTLSGDLTLVLDGIDGFLGGRKLVDHVGLCTILLICL